MRVDFVAVDDAATEIYGGAAPAHVSIKIAAGCAGDFTGLAGHTQVLSRLHGAGHHSAALRHHWGITTFGILSFIVAIIGLIEGIIYLTKPDDQFNQEYVIQRKSWF